MSYCYQNETCDGKPFPRGMRKLAEVGVQGEKKQNLLVCHCSQNSVIFRIRIMFYPTESCISLYHVLYNPLEQPLIKPQMEDLDLYF
jgi:hypothetical protein